MVFLASAFLVGGCVALGWKFGPGRSSTSKDLFSKPPVVVQRDEQFFLAWTQGTNPFFFQPDYKAMDGRLVFALGATTSSGSLAGRYREMKIVADKMGRASCRERVFRVV